MRERERDGDHSMANRHCPPACPYTESYQRQKEQSNDLWRSAEFKIQLLTMPFLTQMLMQLLYCRVALPKRSHGSCFQANTGRNGYLELYFVLNWKENCKITITISHILYSFMIDKILSYRLSFLTWPSYEASWGFCCYLIGCFMGISHIWEKNKTLSPKKSVLSRITQLVRGMHACSVVSDSLPPHGL